MFAHVPEVGKGSGHPTPKLADRWKSAVWLGKSDLTDTHWIRTDEGVVYARSARLAEHSSSLGNLSAVVDNTTETEVDDSGKFLLQPNLSLLHMQHQKYLKMRRRNPWRNQRKTNK